MNRSLIKAVSGWLRTPRFFFSKPQKQRTTSSDHRYPRTLIKEEPEQKPQYDLKKIDVSKDNIVKQILMANMTMAALIPFWPPFNCALVLLNGGFIISQLGHQLKHFLILYNNNHIEQMNQFPKVSNILKLNLLDTTIFSVLSTLMAYHFYSISLLVTGSWYLFKIYTEVFPQRFAFLLIPLFFAITLNIAMNYLQKAEIDLLEGIPGIEGQNE